MIDANLKMWLIEVNKSPCFSYSTKVTRELVPAFMDDLAKIIMEKADKHTNNDTDTGNLELVIEIPFVKDSHQEIRTAEEYVVKGKKIVNPANQK